jgi:hypothetical protein
MVTSVTKAALLVQFASLVGLGVVGVAGVPDERGVDAAVVAVAASSVAEDSVGATVAVGAWVFVVVTAGISVEACALQPASRIIVTIKATANLLRIIVASFVHYAWDEPILDIFCDGSND